MLKVGWFSTARGESSRKLLKSVWESIQTNLLQARIEFVFCSREAGEYENTDRFISQVGDYNLPLVTLSVNQYAAKYRQTVGIKGEQLPDWRLAYDHQIIELLKNYRVDICLLAGYMLIVGPEMCRKFNMINLHPALPTGPKGTWQEVIWTLMAESASQSGAMMHLVTPALDRGPVITYCSYPITGPDFDDEWKEVNDAGMEKIKSGQGENNRLFQKIRQTGFIREIPLIIYTLKSLGAGKIRINNDQSLIDDKGSTISGFDLTDEINQAIRI